MFRFIHFLREHINWKVSGTVCPTICSLLPQQTCEVVWSRQGSSNADEDPAQVGIGARDTAALPRAIDFRSGSSGWGGRICRFAIYNFLTHLASTSPVRGATIGFVPQRTAIVDRNRVNA